MAKSGEDLLIPEATEHQPRDTSTVLTVFETFASNNMRKQTLRRLAEAYHVEPINPWSDTSITFNASDEPNSEQLENSRIGTQSYSGRLSPHQGTHGWRQRIEPHL